MEVCLKKAFHTEAVASADIWKYVCSGSMLLSFTFFLLLSRGNRTLKSEFGLKVEMDILLWLLGHSQRDHFNLPIAESMYCRIRRWPIVNDEVILLYLFLVLILVEICLGKLV